VIPVTAAVQAGDVVVLEVAFANLNLAPALQTVTDSRSNEWILTGRYVSGLNTDLQTFDLIGEISTTLQPGDSITIPFNPINATGPYTAIAAAQEYSGVTPLLDGLASVDGGTGGTNSFDTSKFGDLTTTNADDLIFAYLAIKSDVVSGFEQTSSSPAFSVATTAQGNELTLIPLYSIESAVGNFSFAGNFGGSTAPFIVIMQAVKGSATSVSNANLSVTKSHVGNFAQGQQNASYTLRVANSGTAPTSGTIGVSDALPVGLSFASASGPGWSCAAVAQTVTCTSTTPLPSGGTSAITVAVNVANDAPSQVVNQASVACGASCTTSGNPAMDPTTITTRATPGAIVSLPTLTLSGFLSLLIAIATIGFFAVRFRSKAR
jgi:uncharacterized repeat protein (TIGR01451 family)